MQEIISLNLEFHSDDTHCYSIVSIQPRRREWMPCFTNNLHAGTCFHKNFWHRPRSCSAVLTEIRCPLHLRRSQHYQPPPSLRWQRSSFWPPTTPTSCLIAPSLHCPRNESPYPTSGNSTWLQHEMFTSRTSAMCWLNTLIGDRDLMSVEMCGHAGRCMHECVSVDQHLHSEAVGGQPEQLVVS